MQDSATLAAFALTAIAIVMSPGPDTLLILRYGLVSGRRAAFAAVAGVQIGLIVHTALAIAGLSALIAASPSLFGGVAIAGALYLGWLGVEALRAPPLMDDETARPPASARKACRDAVLTNILNPKVILLFVALYPNFIVLGRGDVTRQLLVLSALLIAINLMWQLPLAWAAKSVRAWLGRASVQRRVSRLAGAILLAFAVLILIEHVI